MKTYRKQAATIITNGCRALGLGIIGLALTILAAPAGAILAPSDACLSATHLELGNATRHHQADLFDVGTFSIDLPTGTMVRIALDDGPHRMQLLGFGCDGDAAAGLRWLDASDTDSLLLTGQAGRYYLRVIGGPAGAGRPYRLATDRTRTATLSEATFEPFVDPPASCPAPLFKDAEDDEMDVTIVQGGAPTYPEARTQEPLFKDAEDDEMDVTIVQGGAPTYPEARTQGPLFKDAEDDEMDVTIVQGGAPTYPEARGQGPLFKDAEDDEMDVTIVQSTVPEWIENDIRRGLPRLETSRHFTIAGGIDTHDADVVRIDLSAPGLLELESDGIDLSASLYADLLCETSSQVAADVPLTKRALQRLLPPGTYYLRLQPTRDGDGRYALGLRFHAIPGLS